MTAGETAVAGLGALAAFGRDAGAAFRVATRRFGAFATFLTAFFAAFFATFLTAFLVAFLADLRETDFFAAMSFPPEYPRLKTFTDLCQ